MSTTKQALILDNDARLFGKCVEKYLNDGWLIYPESLKALVSGEGLLAKYCFACLMHKEEDGN